MSGFLFLIVMDWIMRRAVENGENGIRWRFTTKLDDLDFADDVALLSSTKQHIQNKTTKMSEEAKRVGLTINKIKTKVMRINAKSQENVTVDGQDISEVDEFTYLGAIICKEGGGMKDMKIRISKARGTFSRLRKIWNTKNITRRTKLRIFKSLVVPVLLYGCETWRMNKGDDNRIDVFQNKCLRRIFKIEWKDHIKNKDILDQAGMKPLSKEVKRRRWKMIGHVLRQDRQNHTNTALTWTPEGKRRKGRPKATWRRTVDRERKEAGWKSWDEARAVAANRAQWRHSVEALCAI